MEAGAVALLSEAIEQGLITDTALLIIIITILFLGFTKVLKPMASRIQIQPTTEEIDMLLSQKISALKIEDVSKQLDELIEKIDGLGDVGHDAERDLEDMKKDLEHVKSILTQFQGHLMYNNGGIGSFGNKELR